LVTISVCIGSGCHLKGSSLIIEHLKQLIETAGIAAEVRLAASFCQGCCTEGVVVKIDDELLTQVTPASITAIFNEKVLSRT